MAFTDSNTASCTMVAVRAWAKGFWPFAIAVFTAIAFHSNTTSAFARADPNTKVAISRHSPRVLCFVPLCVFFIVLPPSFTGFRFIRDWHACGKGRLLSISESVSRRYALCPSKHKQGLHLRR